MEYSLSLHENITKHFLIARELRLNPNYLHLAMNIFRRVQILSLDQSIKKSFTTKEIMNMCFYLAFKIDIEDQIQNGVWYRLFSGRQYSDLQKLELGILALIDYRCYSNTIYETCLNDYSVTTFDMKRVKGICNSFLWKKKVSLTRVKNVIESKNDVYWKPFYLSNEKCTKWPVSLETRYSLPNSLQRFQDNLSISMYYLDEWKYHTFLSNTPF